jgi:GNAT superfamily N-acetyltransferase
MTDVQNKIRNANGGDISGIAAMVQRYWAFEGISGFDHTNVARQLERVASGRDLGSVIVASDGEKLIGYLIAVYVFSLEHLGLTAEIDEFYVEPEYRSRGIGSSLLNAAEHAAGDAGCTNLSLQLSDDNHRAREMYLRHVFSPRSGYSLLEKELETS